VSASPWAWRAPTVAAAMQRPYDNFALIRLGLALAVVVSHAFSVTTGMVADEPLAALTGFTLGEHAVNGFFAVSGFLVTMSYDRRGWRDYVIARALRIAPGLVAATLVVALVFGAALTRLPLWDYWRDPALWRFIAGTLTTFKSNAALPGVFADNPFTFPMGTVWTLKYEVLCYFGVLGLGLCGLLRRNAVLILAAGLLCAVAGLDALRPDAPKGMQTALRLPLIFCLGGLLYLWRNRVRVSALAVVGLAGMAAAFSGTFLYHAVLFTAESYAVLWLALAPGLSRPAFDLKHDLSYGTYLYGWPVQQALHQVFPTAAALTLLGPSIGLTLAVAALSWFGIERPALALKFRSVGRRALKTIEPAAP
jgi:peptidoglycan/LPS O-acetylase OafA/YrhL